MSDVDERWFHVVQTSGNFRNVIGEMTEAALYGHLANRFASEEKAATILTELEEKNESVGQFPDSLGIQTRIEIHRLVKDSWEKSIGDLAVTYSIEGIVGVHFDYTCKCSRRDNADNYVLASAQSTRQLTRDEIEALPRFVELVSSRTPR